MFWLGCIHHSTGGLAVMKLQLVARLNNISLNTKETVKREFPKLFSGQGKMEGKYTIVTKPVSQPFSLSMPGCISLQLMPKVKEGLNHMEWQGVISKLEDFGLRTAYGIGAVLLQCQKGTDRKPVAYALRVLSNTDQQIERKFQSEK